MRGILHLATADRLRARVMATTATVAANVRKGWKADTRAELKVGIPTLAAMETWAKATAAAA